MAVPGDAARNHVSAGIPTPGEAASLAHRASALVSGGRREETGRGLTTGLVMAETS